MQLTHRNQRVLVVGGSSGIGLEIAKSFYEQGAEVTIAARNYTRLEQAAIYIGKGTYIVELDITNPEIIGDFFKSSRPWDNIIVTAASSTFGGIKDISLADAKLTFESKFWGSYHIARLANFSPNGSLTFISGRFAQRAGQQTALISAVNACIEGFARGLACELSPVRVNVISPGFIDTGLHSNTLLQQMSERSLALPIKRIGKPKDIASAALFLATNEFISGAVISVDGGDTSTFI